MRKEFAVFAVILILTSLAACHLPGLMGLRSAIIQDRILLVMLPALLAFIWWTWDRA